MKRLAAVPLSSAELLPAYGMHGRKADAGVAKLCLECTAPLLLLYPRHGGLESEAEGLTCVHRVSVTDDRKVGVATLSLSNPKAADGQLRELLSVDELRLQPRGR